MKFSIKERKRRSIFMKRLHQNPEFQIARNLRSSKVMLRLNKDSKFLAEKSRRSSRVMKALHKNKEFQKKMSDISSETMTETNLSPSFKRKLKLRMSRRLKEQWKDLKFRERRIKVSGEMITKYNKSLKGRRAARKRMLARRCTPKFIEAIKKSIISGPQRILYNRLCESGLKNLKLEYFVAPYLLDIAHIPTKTNIESDGTWHHRNRKAKDKARDEYLIRRGWKIIRVPNNTTKEAKVIDIVDILTFCARKI